MLLPAYVILERFKTSIQVISSRIYWQKTQNLDGILHMKTQQQDLDDIQHIKANNTLGFGCGSKIDGRQDSIIVMAFYVSWKTKQSYLDGIQFMMAKSTVRFVWHSTNNDITGTVLAFYLS